MNSMNSAKFQKQIDRLKNAIRGMIFGQCLGDAVGLRTEFKFKRDRPPVTFPYTEKIRGCDLCDWTDDSDQMILILETMLQSKNDFTQSSLSTEDLKFFAKRLKEWRTHGFPELGDTCGFGIGGNTMMVTNHPDFDSDPLKASREIWYNSGRSLAANGGVMRTSILACMCIKPIIEGRMRHYKPFYKTVQDICMVTHSDPRCIISCWIVAFLCQQMLYINTWEEPALLGKLDVDCLKIIQTLDKELIVDRPRRVSANRNKEITRHQPTPKCYLDEDYIDPQTGEYDYIQELFDYYGKSTKLENLELDQVGTIGYTYKCVACALWCLRIIQGCHRQGGTPDFKKVIYRVAEECGDADTNASVVGALLGAYLGYDGLPQDWIRALPHRIWLDKKIDLLWQKINTSLVC